MTETLTESFCERCGTRYEFTAPTRLNPLRKTRGFIGGLKNYLTSQDDMSDAMRDAMRQQEEALASAQLEAFHESFNFCIDCRQYTCVNCWNDAAGRCRSCAPIAGTDDLAERLAASMAGNGSVAVAEPLLGQDDVQRRLGLDAWPTSDLPAEPSNGHRGDIGWPEADATATDRTTEPVPEPIVAEELEPEPEPVVAEEPVPEPEPRPRPRITPISETILRFPERGAETQAPAERQVAEDDSPEMAARRAQLDLLGLGDPGEGPVEPARPSVMPYRSRGAAASRGHAAGRGTRAGGFWEASAREVAGAAAAIGVQNCGQCGLSLSANARFCRRCGTRQAQSA